MKTAYQVIHIEKRKSIAAGLNRHITRKQFVTVGEDRTVAVWVPDNADPNRTAENVELVSREFVNEEGQKYELTLQQAVDKRIKEAGIKVRQGQSTCLEIIFSGSHDVMVAMNKTKLRQWADDTLKWAHKTWGEDNVVSASLHVDEKTPHIHMIVVPIVTGQSRRTKSYKQNAERQGKSTRSYKINHNKPRLCVNEVYTSGRLYEYHNSYAKEVSKKYGLGRGVKAEPGSKKNHHNSEDYNRQLAVQVAEQQALIQELTADYEDKKAEIQEDIQQLQNNLGTISAAVEEEEEKRKAAEKTAKDAEEQYKQAVESLSSKEKEIAANEVTLSKLSDEILEKQSYLRELNSIENEISRKKAELSALSSLGLQKMIMETPKRIFADIQERVKGYCMGKVTNYEEVKYPVGDGPEESFAKIYIKNNDKEYFIEVREKTGDVYYNGSTEPYKWKETGEEMVMPELAEYFRSDLTPEAKQYVESLYKKPTQTEEIVWQSRQILGAAKILKKAEGLFTLKIFDRDFKKWVKVTDCVKYSVKSNDTYDCIAITLANGDKKYYTQFGQEVTEKLLRKFGLGKNNNSGGQSL